MRQQFTHERHKVGEIKKLVRVLNAFAPLQFATTRLDSLQRFYIEIILSENF